MVDLTGEHDIQDINIINPSGIVVDPSTVLAQYAIRDKIQERLDPYQGMFHARFFENVGSSEMAVDGSVTPVDFTVGPAAGKIYVVKRIVVFIAASNMNFSKFGSISGGLTNGLLFKAKENGAERDLIPGAVKTNARFMAWNASIISSGADILIAVIDMEKIGTVFKLQDSTSDYLKITVQDDLTPINVDEFLVLTQGYEVTE